jgi:hypothetical protein
VFATPVMAGKSTPSWIPGRAPVFSTGPFG